MKLTQTQENGLMKAWKFPKNMITEDILTHKQKITSLMFTYKSSEILYAQRTLAFDIQNLRLSVKCQEVFPGT